MLSNIPVNSRLIKKKRVCKKHRLCVSQLIEIARGPQKDKFNIVEISAVLAFQCSQISSLSVWLKFHLAFLSIIKETYLCPELFGRPRRMLNFRVFIESVDGWAALLLRTLHQALWWDRGSGADGGVWGNHFQTEAAVLEMIDTPPPLFLKK